MKSTTPSPTQNPVGSSPRRLHIQSLTINQLGESPSPISRFQDDHGFLPDDLSQWLNLLQQNPHFQPEDPALVIALDNDKVIGRLGLYRGIMTKSDGQCGPIFWLDGFFLDPNYLDSGAGGMILLKAMSYRYPLIANGGPAEGTKKLYKATGFKEIGPTYRFLFPLRSKPFLVYFLPNKTLAHLLSLPAQPVLESALFIWRLFKNRRQDSLVFQPVSCFHSTIDRLYEGLGLQHFPRNAATLNWAMTHRPSIKALELYRQDRLCGYLLLRTESIQDGGAHDLPLMDVGFIVDYFIQDAKPEELSTMLRFSIDYFRGEKVDVIQCQAHGELATVCRNHGMVAKGGNHIFFRDKKGGIPTPDMWFLTNGAGDVILNG